MTRKAFVYKCYDVDGVLIYVGQSKSVMVRLSDHQYLPGSNPKRNTLEAIARVTGIAMDRIGASE